MRRWKLKGDSKPGYVPRWEVEGNPPLFIGDEVEVVECRPPASPGTEASWRKQAIEAATKANYAGSRHPSESPVREAVLTTIEVAEPYIRALVGDETEQINYLNGCYMEEKEEAEGRAEKAEATLKRVRASLMAFMQGESGLPFDDPYTAVRTALEEIDQWGAEWGPDKIAAIGCERCEGRGELEGEEMRGAQFVPVGKPCPDCQEATS